MMPSEVLTPLSNSMSPNSSCSSFGSASIASMEWDDDGSDTSLVVDDMVELLKISAAAISRNAVRLFYRALVASLFVSVRFFSFFSLI